MDQKTEDRLRAAAAESAEGFGTPGDFQFRQARGSAPAAGIVGWERYSWKGIKRRCVRCTRKVTSGVVRLGMAGREADPVFKVLCSSCYTDILELQTPEGSWSE
jgi:hypothetical protein